MNMQRSTTATKYRIGRKACLSVVPEADAILTEIASLQTLSHAELKQRWQDVFGTSVPHNMSKRLLIHALAYDLQGQVHGGLKKPVKQMLADAIAAMHQRGAVRYCPTNPQTDRVSCDANADLSPLLYPQNTSASHNFIAVDSQPQSSMRPLPPVVLSPGTRLMREWRGVVHVVDRTAEGFMWSGKIYGSLSAIARAITGVRWNGLAFFGLRKRQVSRQPSPDKTLADNLLLSGNQQTMSDQIP